MEEKPILSKMMTAATDIYILVCIVSNICGMIKFFTSSNIFMSQLQFDIYKLVVWKLIFEIYKEMWT